MEIVPVRNIDFVAGGVDMEDFFDQLSSLKDQNLNELRNSGVVAPGQPIMPKEKNPNEMQDFKDELDANRQIQADSKGAWDLTMKKIATKKAITYGLAAFLGYKILF